MGERAFTGMVLALSLEACSQDELQPPPDAQSAYVDIYLDDGIAVCGGQLDAYDRFIEDAFAVWTGEGVPSDFRAAIHTRRTSVCSHGGSCARRDGTVELHGQLAQYHELSHLVHNAVGGWSAFVLNEGVAESLGPLLPYVVNGAAVSRDRLFEFRDHSSAYHLQAAAFVRFLLERHGGDNFRGYFQALAGPEHPTPLRFHEEFEAAFGESLDSAWPDFTSASWCAYESWYCGGGVPIDLPFSLNELDCNSSETLGFSAPDLEYDLHRGYRPFQILHLDNPTPRRIVVEGDVHFSFVRCGVCSLDDPPNGGRLEGSSAVIAVEEGTYAFIVQQDSPTARLSLREEDN
jgi:hypothetical protein